MSLDQLITEQRLAHCREGLFAWIGWLFQVALRLGPLSRSRSLARFLRRCERCVEGLCFLMAFRRSCKKLQRPRIASVRKGFRIVRSNGRLFFKSARIRARRATLSERILRLMEVLADPERYVAHFLKRILRGLRPTHLVSCAPPAFALASTLQQQPSPADTS